MSKKSNKVTNSIKNIKSLKNNLTDVVPSNPFTPEQLSQYETLYTNVQYAPLTIQRVILNYLYASHGILQTAVEQPVQDALRGGVDIVSGELSPDDLGVLEDYLERNSIMSLIMQVGIVMLLLMHSSSSSDYLAILSTEYWCCGFVSSIALLVLYRTRT